MILSIAVLPVKCLLKFKAWPKIKYGMFVLKGVQFTNPDHGTVNINIPDELWGIESSS